LGGHVLQLIAVGADGLESGRWGPLAQGIHLRWAFPLDLGFPLGGFVLSRALGWRDEFETLSFGEPAKLAELPPFPGNDGGVIPTSDVALRRTASEFRNRVQRLPADHLSHGPTPDYLRLAALLAHAMRANEGHQNPSERDLQTEARASGPRARLRPLEVLMAAATDPRVARALGLAWVDATLPPGRIARYQINANWASQSYPEETTPPCDTLAPSVVTARPLRWGRLRLITPRRCELRAKTTSPHLVFAGVASLPLHLEFPTEVTRVHVEVASQAGDWHASLFAPDGTLMDPAQTASESLARNDRGFAVTSNVAFRAMMISGPDGPWRIRKIRWRAGNGAINTALASVDVNISEGDALRPPAVPDLAPAPATPDVPRMITAWREGLISTDGQIFASGSEARVMTSVALKDDDPLAPTGADAVRLDGAPLTDEADPTEVFAARSLRDRLAVRVCAWRGTGRTVGEGGEGGDFAPSGEGRQLAEVDAFTASLGNVRRALFFEGNQYVIARGVDALRQPGDTLLIQLWLRIAEDAPAQPSTLLDNGFGGFALQLFATDDGFTPAFRANGSVTRSSVVLQPGRWTGLSVLYEAAAITFTVDGIDGQKRERVAFGAARAVQSGGDSFTIGASLTPIGFAGYFNGLITSLSIWRRPRIRAIAWPDTASLVVSLDGHLREEVSKVEVETRGDVQFVTGPNQAPALEAARFDGDSWLRLAIATWARPRRAMHVRALIRPDAEAPTSTVVGASWRSSWWLGVVPAQAASTISVFPQELPRAGDRPGQVSSLRVPELQLPKSARRALLEAAGRRGTSSPLTGLERTGILRAAPDRAFRVRAYINGVRFDSTGTIEAERWSTVGADYDGRHVRIFIDGEVDSEHPAELGLVAMSAEPRVGIGADVPQGTFRFRGAIGQVVVDARAWTEPTPSPLRRREARFEQREISLVPPADTSWLDANLLGHGLLGFGQVLVPKRLEARIVDRPPPGDYAYAVRHSDAFGRVSDWSPVQAVTIDRGEPKPPIRLTSSSLPLRGRVDLVNEPWRLRLRLLDVDDLDTSRLKTVLGGVDIETRTRGRRQTFQIIDAQAVNSSAFDLRLRAPEFPLFPIEVDDKVVIQIDRKLRINWLLSGAQVLFEPHVDHFEVFQRTGALDQIAGVVSQIRRNGRRSWIISADTDRPVELEDLDGRVVQVAGIVFDLVALAPSNANTTDLTVRSRLEPPYEPRLGDAVAIGLKAGDPAFADAGAGETWGDVVARVEARPPVRREISFDQPATVRAVTADELAAVGGMTRADEDARLVALEAPGLVLPEEHRRRSTEYGAPAAALVFDQAASGDPWRVLDVPAWSGTDAGTTLFVFVAEAPSGDEPSRHVARMRVVDLRFVLGERYEVDITLPPDIVSPKLGRAPVLVSVAAVRDGRRGAFAAPATSVAVLRRRPSPPPVPTADPQPADDLGASEVVVTWPELTAPTGEVAGYRLYRAIDSAVFAHDLERRRSDPSAYAPAADLLFADDPDFETWRRARFPEETLAQIYAGGGSPAFWREWARRFYRSRSTAEIGTLARRAGNEQAFTLLTKALVHERRYVDRIAGRKDNAVMYRVRSVSTAGLASGFSGVSEPAATPSFRAPPAPTFRNVTGGDRQVALSWNAQRSAAVQSYLVYRSFDRRDVADPRWFDKSRPGSARIEIATPSPVVLTPTEVAMVLDSDEEFTVRAVYMVAEYDHTRSPLDQPAAMNHWRSEPGNASTVDAANGRLRLRNLRPIPAGAPVAVVVESGASGFRVVGPTPPMMRDAGLAGRRTYYYSVVAVGAQGARSQPSAPVAVRTTASGPPPLPACVVEPDPAGGGIELSFDGETAPDASFRPQWRTGALEPWLNLGPWRRLTQSTRASLDRPTEAAFVLRVLGRTEGQRAPITLGEHIVGGEPR